VSEHINFDNLREMTDGDAQVEQELFQVFIDTAEECLDLMRSSCESDDREIWRTQAHALKGISLNLGAEPLGILCHHAQLSFNSPPSDKVELLKVIVAEYNNVKAELRESCPSDQASSQFR
jgi:HPt (histidine-containing phosphotransfer) domain-containing protein